VTTRALLHTAVLALAVSLGFVGGRLTERRPVAIVNGPRDTPLAPLRALAAVSPQATFDAAAEREALRAIIREELRAAKAPEGAEAVEPPRAEGSPPESAAAYASSTSLVSAALTARSWTDRDVQELHQLLPQLSQAQREEVLHRLVPALNRGDLKVAFSGRPF
jgi:hypothetical protein